MLPESFIQSLEGLTGFDKAAFVAVHEQREQITSVRLNESKPFELSHHPFLHQITQVPWCTNGYYLQDRPLFVQDPLWHAGAYYVQEASSMFLHLFCLRFILQLPIKLC
jgi:16S rRNA C967 or C1407 C5-methylase (RsmB/RsmF family)